MLEKDIQKAIVNWCNGKDWIWIVKVNGGPFGKIGSPDLVLCVRGKFVGLEVKGLGGKVGKMQERMRELVMKSGGICEVVRSVEEAVGVIEGVQG